MKLDELRLSDVTTWCISYKRFRPGRYPKRSLPASCKTSRSACKRSPRRSTYLSWGTCTFCRFETDDLTFDAENFLQPSGHALIQFLASADVDALAVGAVFECYHHQYILLNQTTPNQIMHHRYVRNDMLNHSFFLRSFGSAFFFPPYLAYRSARKLCWLLLRPWMAATKAPISFNFSSSNYSLSSFSRRTFPFVLSKALYFVIVLLAMAYSKNLMNLGMSPFVLRGMHSSNSVIFPLCSS